MEGVSLVHYADLAVADSPFSAEQLVEQYGFDRTRVRVLPLAVSLDRFAPGPKDADLIHRLSLEGRRVLLFTGRMAGNKRVDLLVEALALVKASIPEAKLLLVGDCDSSDAYRQITRKAQASSCRTGGCRRRSFHRTR